MTKCESFSAWLSLFPPSLQFCWIRCSENLQKRVECSTNISPHPLQNSLWKANHGKTARLVFCATDRAVHWNQWLRRPNVFLESDTAVYKTCWWTLKPFDSAWIFVSALSLLEVSILTPKIVDSEADRTSLEPQTKWMQKLRFYQNSVFFKPPDVMGSNVCDLAWTWVYLCIFSSLRIVHFVNSGFGGFAFVPAFFFALGFLFVLDLLFDFPFGLFDGLAKTRFDFISSHK